MKYLFDQLKTIELKTAGKKIFLFLDFDGTLTPIVNSPDRATLSKKAKNILRKLALNPNVQLAIISGRSMEDIKSKVGIEEIMYSGNHGLEIAGPGYSFEKEIPAGELKAMEKIKLILEKSLEKYKGITIENKRLTLSIHYRLLDKKHQSEIFHFINKVIAPFQSENKLITRQGKMVFEIYPFHSWNKGNAVEWLLNRINHSENDIHTIYIGDDVTDEDAFRILKGRGTTIRVGKSDSTEAGFFLKDEEEVLMFLNRILK